MNLAEASNYAKKMLGNHWVKWIHRGADYIKSEIERQALLAYQCGDYILGSRNEYGQRINTVIHLKRRDTGADVSFVSGWMSYPDGRLVLITPYGGKRK